MKENDIEFSEVESFSRKMFETFASYFDSDAETLIKEHLELCQNLKKVRWSNKKLLALTYLRFVPAMKAALEEYRQKIDIGDDFLFYIMQKSDLNDAIFDYAKQIKHSIRGNQNVLDAVKDAARSIAEIKKYYSFARQEDFDLGENGEIKVLDDNYEYIKLRTEFEQQTKDLGDTYVLEHYAYRAKHKQRVEHIKALRAKPESRYDGYLKLSIEADQTAIDSYNLRLADLTEKINSLQTYVYIQKRLPIEAKATINSILSSKDPDGDLYI